MAVNVGPTSGIVDASSAPAGQVGEVIESVATLDSVAVVTLTPQNITSITLTAGDWEVSGSVHYKAPAGTNSINGVEATISSTSATRNLTPRAMGGFAIMGNLGANQRTTAAIPPRQINVATPTTLYLVSYVEVTAGSLAAGGFLHARRVR